MKQLMEEDPDLAEQLRIAGEVVGDDWGYDNLKYEGVDGFEDFEPDFSE